MRTKYNEKITYREGAKGRSNIYLKYFDYIEDLLTPTIDSYCKYSYEKLYVKHSLYNELEHYADVRNVDKFLYVTGVTGTGKTSLLKAVFKHYENTYVIRDNTLVIPFACDNHVGEPDELKKRLSSLFFGITIMLCDTYGLKKYCDNAENFHEYIRERRIQFSVNQRGWRELSPSGLIDQLYEDNPLELSLLAFKYTMKQEGNPINNVVFIMDDVESIGRQKEVFPIYLANKVMACLDNRSRMEKEKWCCTVIAACRHYVYRLLTTKKNKQEEDPLLAAAGIERSTMESFWGDDIDIGKCPPLKAIIEKREKAIAESMSEEEKKDFAEICLVLNSIVKQTGELLLSLNVNDYRATFARLKGMICNKRWLQRFDSSGGAFKIGTAEDNYFHNKPNVMRALAMDENDVYFGDESIIPNLLENRKDGGDLWKLLIMSLFANNMKSDWNSSIDLELLDTKMERIFGESKEYMKEIKDALVLLIEDRLLLRGKIEEQHDSVDLRHQDAIKAKFVYPSGAVKILWNSLAENSVLFEIFVDDIWIENPYRKETDTGKKFNQFNLYNFKECMYYLEALTAVEFDIRRFVKNRAAVREYTYYFGREPVTKQLYQGLWNSYSAYFKDKSGVDEKEQKLLAQQLKNLEKKINSCDELFAMT